MAVEFVEVARPYAEAAHKFARESNKAPAWQEMLDALADAVTERLVSGMLEDPRVTPAQASAVLGALAERIAKGHGDQSEPFANFCHQLLANGRIEAVREIADKFRELHHASEHMLDVEIRTAFELSASTITAIKEKLMEKHNASEVNVTVAMDEGLIGGIMVIAGDSVIDGTVQAELASMQTALGRSA